MAAFNAPIRFFLGANTPNGFTGFAEELYDAENGWQAYLIKSGAGTGKSTLMCRVYEAVTALSVEAEAICCSSDPSSLDGVVCPTLKLCIMDATAPHVVEPKFWGAVEQIVPLAVCMDEHRLKDNAEAIRRATERNRDLHRQCRKYIHAAGVLLRENRRIGEALIDTDKIHRLAERLARQEFGTGTGYGRLTHRFLSAVTPDGLVTFEETLQALCPRIYTIEDEQGAASRVLLEDVARYAQLAGVDGIVCPCPLSLDTSAEHLLFPSVGVAFTTSNAFHRADYPVYRRIHATRFCDAERLREKRQIQSFNRRAARELLEQARECAVNAKAVHDTMEEYSRAAMDWDAAEAMGNRIVRVFTDAARKLY